VFAKPEASDSGWARCSGGAHEVVAHERDQLERAMEGVGDRLAAIGGYSNAELAADLGEHEWPARNRRGVECGQPPDCGFVLGVREADRDRVVWEGEHAMKDHPPDP